MGMIAKSRIANKFLWVFKYFPTNIEHLCMNKNKERDFKSQISLFPDSGSDSESNF